MELRQYPQLGEQVYWDELPNGLTVAVVPRPGFTKKLCYFAADFGAIHTDFTLGGRQMQMPAGVAHYLEHKLFDMPGRDISAEFAALGASPNAFTGYDMTAYYFSCTDNFEQCLQLLLEFVTTPHFTQQSVDKERGIITQEIAMNEDSPDTRVFENLMQAMYERHPIGQPILGTRESIGRITPESLTACHKAFYRPDNMLLCVVGDVDPALVRSAALELLPQQERPQQQRRWDEPMTCPRQLVTDRMEVAMPTFQLGFKCEPLTHGPEAVRQEIIGDLAAEVLFGESSALYLQLYEQGLIDSAFGGGFETVEGMAMLSASGDSDDPEAIRDAIIRRAHQLVQDGIDRDDFQRLKRSALGRRIRDLDSFDATCFRLCAYHLSGFDYFRFPELYSQIQPEDIREFLQRTVTQERAALSVIYPITQEETT